MRRCHPRYTRRMRIWLLTALALAACGNKSKLDVAGGAEADALWDLAPDGTEVGVVASPRALGFATRALAAVDRLAATPDFMAPLRPKLDAIDGGALLGRRGATFADAGLSSERAASRCSVATDGVIAVMPVVDRAKFMAAKHGTVGTGSGDDRLEGSTCRHVRDVYVCATGDAMFDRLGKGALRGKAALAGARGDLELYAPQLPLSGGTPGELRGRRRPRRRPASRSTAGGPGHPGGHPGDVRLGEVAPHPDATERLGRVVALDIAKLLGGPAAAAARRRRDHAAAARRHDQRPGVGDGAGGLGRPRGPRPAHRSGACEERDRSLRGAQAVRRRDRDPDPGRVPVPDPERERARARGMGGRHRAADRCSQGRAEAKGSAERADPDRTRASRPETGRRCSGAGARC